MGVLMQESLGSDEADFADSRRSVHTTRRVRRNRRDNTYINEYYFGGGASLLFSVALLYP